MPGETRQPLPVAPLSDAVAKAINFRIKELSQTADEARLELISDVDDAWLARVEDTPLEKLSWGQLSRMAASGRAEQAGILWGKVLAKASAEQDNGEAAAQLIRGVADSPIARARFHALRNGIRRDWRPTGQLEATLVDQIAHATTLQTFWFEVHCNLTGSTRWQDRDELPRMEQAEAESHALQMVERFNKMLLRLIRVLRDLRRIAPPVVVQNAGQVNVGHQQVNLG